MFCYYRLVREQGKIMDQLVEDITRHSIDWVGRAESLQPIISANAERTESGGRVTDEVMAALHEQQLFRMALPKSSSRLLPESESNF